MKNPKGKEFKERENIGMTLVGRDSEIGERRREREGCRSRRGEKSERI